MELGFDACRRRQIASTSLGGRARIFSTSMNESNGLMLLATPPAPAAFIASDGGSNGGGTSDELDDGSGSGFKTVEAFRRRSAIFSL